MYVLCIAQIYVYGSFSFILVHEECWFPRGAQTKNKKNRPRNGQKRIMLMTLDDGIKALHPNINISISKYAPEKNIENTGRNFLDIFPDGGPILYIFLLFHCLILK